MDSPELKLSLSLRLESNRSNCEKFEIESDPSNLEDFEKRDLEVSEMSYHYINLMLSIVNIITLLRFEISRLFFQQVIYLMQ